MGINVIFGFLIVLVAFLPGRGDGISYYRGKVINAKTKNGIKGIVISCGYYGTGEYEGGGGGVSGDDGTFRVGYSVYQGDISPRFCRLSDKDGENNGGYFSSRVIMPVENWYPTRDQEQIVEMYQCVGEGCY